MRAAEKSHARTERDMRPAPGSDLHLLGKGGTAFRPASSGCVDGPGLSVAPYLHFPSWTMDPAQACPCPVQRCQHAEAPGARRLAPSRTTRPAGPQAAQAPSASYSAMAPALRYQQPAPPGPPPRPRLCPPGPRQGFLAPAAGAATPMLSGCAAEKRGAAQAVLRPETALVNASASAGRRWPARPR